MASYKNSCSMDAAARDENGAALLFSGASTGATAALPRNDAGAAYLCYPGASEDAGAAAYRYHYSGTPTTEGGHEHGAAYAFSGERTTRTLIDGGAADLFPGAHAAAPTKNGAPYMFLGVHVPTAAETKDDAACLYPSVHADAALSQVTNGAPVIFSDVRGKMLPYQTQTTAAAVKPPAAGYYNTGVLAGEALPLVSQVFGAKTTSVPAVAVGQDNVAGAFTERLRSGLPVLGLSLASLAVATRTLP